MRSTGTIFKDSDTPLWAMAASFVALISAFGFQYLGGMAPCELCLWQRIPSWRGDRWWYRRITMVPQQTRTSVLTWSAAIMFAVGASIAYITLV